MMAAGQADPAHQCPYARPRHDRARRGPNECRRARRARGRARAPCRRAPRAPWRCPGSRARSRSPSHAACGPRGGSRPGAAATDRASSGRKARRPHEAAIATAGATIRATSVSGAPRLSRHPHSLRCSCLLRRRRALDCACLAWASMLLRSSPRARRRTLRLSGVSRVAAARFDLGGSRSGPVSREPARRPRRWSVRGARSCWSPRPTPTATAPPRWPRPPSARASRSWGSRRCTRACSCGWPGCRLPIVALSPLLPARSTRRWRTRSTRPSRDVVFARELSRGRARRGRPVRFHVEIDTGMGRIGVREERGRGVPRARRARCRACVSRACTRTSPTPTPRTSRSPATRCTRFAALLAAARARAGCKPPRVARGQQRRHREPAARRSSTGCAWG